MRELKPYRTLHALQAAIDNGGRFYNLLTSANDQVVTRGELAKAAGVFSAGARAFLFLEMAQQDLAADDRQAIQNLLDVGLRKRYVRYRPVSLSPSAVETEGSIGQSVIVTGYPRFVEDRRQIGGFIVVPAGKVFVMIPIMDRFDVYEVFDDRQMRSRNSVIATVRGQRLEHDGPIRFAGVLRKLSFKDKTKKDHKFFLETVYYTKL